MKPLRILCENCKRGYTVTHGPSMIDFCCPECGSGKVAATEIGSPISHEVLSKAGDTWLELRLIKVDIDNVDITPAIVVLSHHLDSMRDETLEAAALKIEQCINSGRVYGLWDFIRAMKGGHS